MQVNLAIAAALVGAGVMVGGPAVAQGRPQDSYALAEAPIPVPHAAVPARVGGAGRHRDPGEAGRRRSPSIRSGWATSSMPTCRGT